MLSSQIKVSDLGYKIIYDYIKKSFVNFLIKINVNRSDNRYTWLNMQIDHTFLKILSFNRSYLLCIKFFNDISGMVSFKINRYF